MTDYIIDCITKKDPEDRYTRITGVGGRHEGMNALAPEKRWYFRTDEAIRMIESGVHRFFVKKGGHTVVVEVGSREGRKHLRTKTDTDLVDNLLKLGQCSLTEQNAIDALVRGWSS